MAFLDRVRRVFAQTGSPPPFKENDPLDYGAGVIKRLKLSNNYRMGNKGQYEEHLGKPRLYMNVYLSDPIVRPTLFLRS